MKIDKKKKKRETFRGQPPVLKSVGLGHLWPPSAMPLHRCELLEKRKVWGLIGRLILLPSSSLHVRSFYNQWAKTSHGERRLSDYMARVGVSQILSPQTVTPSSGQSCLLQLADYDSDSDSAALMERARRLWVHYLFLWDIAQSTHWVYDEICTHSCTFWGLIFPSAP